MGLPETRNVNIAVKADPLTAAESVIRNEPDVLLHIDKWHNGTFDRNIFQYLDQQFQQQNQQKLDVLLNGLPPTQQQFIQALPLLFHLNSPSLPGYNPQAPVVIDNFTANPNQTAALQKFVPAFAPPHTPSAHAGIEAVFIMGSAGSVAHTKHSDIDVWVCAQSHELGPLQQKIDQISQWAQTFNLDLQGFAVHHQQFRGPQHQCKNIANSPLLLDEFYRSSCWLAGKKPLWWLIPTELTPTAYQNYAQKLVNHKYINASQYIDFGAVQAFAKPDLLLAGLRELQQAFTNPYKSSLKLALVQSYTQHANPLSKTYKDHVINQTTDVVDTYLLLAAHLDKHFSGDALKALRHAWVIKTARGNSRLTSSSAWHKQLNGWGIEIAKVEMLRWHERWNISDILDEHCSLSMIFKTHLDWLTQLYNQCADQLDNPKEVKHTLEDIRAQLTRYLEYFQRPNDTNNISNTNLTPKRVLPTLVPKNHSASAILVQPTKRQPYWQLQEEGSCVIHHQRLVPILYWLKANNFSQHSLHPAQLNTGLKGLWSLIPQPFDPPLLILNSEAFDHETWSLKVISEHDDPLSYSQQHHNTLLSLDLIDPSNGEHRHYHWSSLAEALPHILELPQVRLAAQSRISQQRLKQRLVKLLHDIRVNLKTTKNYLYQSGKTLHRVKIAGEDTNSSHIGRASKTIEVESFTSVKQWLQTDNSTFDLQCDVLLDLPLSTDNMNLVLVDRNNSTQFYFPGYQHPPAQVNKRNYAEAIQSVVLFCAQRKLRHESTPNLLTLDYRQDKLANFARALVPIKIDQIEPNLRLKVSIEAKNLGGWQIQCGPKIWQVDALNQKTLKPLVDEVLKHRTSSINYALHLTDLRLGSGSFIEHFLTKLDIEAQLTSLAEKG